MAAGWKKVYTDAHVIPVANGGTGLSTYAEGDLIYASAANTLDKVAWVATATRYIANTGASSTPAWAQIDLSNGVTGTLPFSAVGTGTTGASQTLTLGAGAKITPNGVSGEIISQVYAGTPTHSATEGVLCWDSTGNILYANNNGTTGWTAIGPGAGASNSFTTVAADSGTSATADSSTDTLTLVGGTGIASVAANDPETVTFNIDGDFRTGAADGAEVPIRGLRAYNATNATIVAITPLAGTMYWDTTNNQLLVYSAA